MFKKTRRGCIPAGATSLRLTVLEKHIHLLHQSFPYSARFRGVEELLSTGHVLMNVSLAKPR